MRMEALITGAFFLRYTPVFDNVAALELDAKQAVIDSSFHNDVRGWPYTHTEAYLIETIAFN